MILTILKNDASVLGLLVVLLTIIFSLEKSSNKHVKNFFKYVPALLLCYFIPSIFNSLGIISGKESNLYFISSRYLLPSSLILLTLSIDLEKIKNLGPKAIIMFLTGTFGILIGGPLSLMIVTKVFPSAIPLSSEDLWRGLSTVAGSWIGGGANQAAMKEMFEVNDEIFSST